MTQPAKESRTCSLFCRRYLLETVYAVVFLLEFSFHQPPPSVNVKWIQLTRVNFKTIGIFFHLLTVATYSSATLRWFG